LDTVSIHNLPGSEHSSDSTHGRAVPFYREARILIPATIAASPCRASMRWLEYVRAILIALLPCLSGR
jgi:hypothetical protein